MNTTTRPALSGYTIGRDADMNARVLQAIASEAQWYEEEPVFVSPFWNRNTKRVTWGVIAIVTVVFWGSLAYYLLK